jgi:hypothetical protein
MELNTPMKILAFCISSFQSSWHFAFHRELRVCLVPYFTQKILGFGSSFCRMELNAMQNFWQKRYPFSILDFGLKRKKKTPHLPKII